MKLFLKICFTFLLVLSFCSPPPTIYRRKGLTANLLKKVTIGIVEITGYESNVAENKITEQFMQRDVRIIERTKILKILQEHGFQQSGFFDNSTAVEIGKIIGVSAIFIGNISTPTVSSVANFHDNTWSTYSVTFSGRLISTKTGETLLSGSASGKRGYPNFAMIDSINNYFKEVFGK